MKILVIYSMTFLFSFLHLSCFCEIFVEHHQEKGNEVVLHYKFPPIIPNNWGSNIQIGVQYGYNCVYMKEFNEILSSHSCIIKYNISLDYLYNYCFLHLQQLHQKNQGIFKLASSITATPSQELMKFRLHLDISRNDTNYHIAPLEAYIEISIANLFRKTILLTEKTIFKHFIYDFYLPIPDYVIDIYHHIIEYDRINFLTNQILFFHINSYIIQDDNIMPIQNEDIDDSRSGSSENNKEIIIFKYSKFYIDFLPPSEEVR